MLSRLSTIVHQCSSPVEAMNEIVNLCREACGNGFQQVVPATLVEDELRVTAWLQRVSEWMATRPTWSVHSWVVGLQSIPRDDGTTYLQLELEGYESRGWVEAYVDEIVYRPEESALFVESLNQAFAFFSSTTELDDSTRDCGEYLMCLAIASVLIRAAVAKCNSEWFTKRRIYVCWAGGDHIEIAGK